MPTFGTGTTGAANQYYPTYKEAAAHLAEGGRGGWLLGGALVGGHGWLSSWLIGVLAVLRIILWSDFPENRSGSFLV
jgi:hypothetical protein